MTQDFGKLEFHDRIATYTYKGVVYTLESNCYEPCIFIEKDGVDICLLHNALTIDKLNEVFSAGGAVKYYRDQKFDEEAFCRILAASIDSKRDDMDLDFAAKLVKDWN